MNQQPPIPVIEKWGAIVLALALILLIPIAVFLLSRFEKIPQPAGEGPYVADEILIKYSLGYAPDEIGDETKKKEIADAFEKAGVISQRKVFKSDDNVLKQYYLLKLKKGSNVKKVQELLNATNIGTSNPNHISKAVTIPNDSLYANNMYGLKKIQMEKAWDITKGSNNVIVAVLDTGIDYNHEDMPKADIINGPDYITCNHYTNDNYDCATGFVKQCPQLAQGYCDDDPMDDFGHGSHVAGTIHATTNNSLGVAGVNWNVKLMSIKVLNSEGSGPESASGDAIRYAADHGAKVINMSLASTVSCQGSPKHPWATIYQDAIDYATSKGVTVVVAAANDNTDASGYAPASCNNVVTVGATDQNDKRASFSNYGSYVDLAAPGVQILSVKAAQCSICNSTLNGKYAYLQGTSMATPHVAGVAALLLSVNPALTPLQIEDCLKRNGDPISTDQAIGKRLNAFESLKACGGTVPTPTAIPIITSTPMPTPTPWIVTPTQQVSTTPVPGSLPEDINRDGCVGLLDFNVWFQTIRSGITPSGTVPDINNDGTVDIVDFNLWFRAMKNLPPEKLC